MTDETHDIPVPRVNRVEYIDTTGRVLVRYLDTPGIVLSFQDGGATLKVFTWDKFATFADPTAAMHAALDPFLDTAEREALFAELATWDGDLSGDASSAPRPPAQ